MKFFNDMIGYIKNNIVNIHGKYEDERKKFNYEINDKTRKYQEKFGFEKNSDPQKPTFWNNESDAFKHAFMQGLL